MEVCVPSNTLACQDISSKSGSSTCPSNPTDYNSGDLSMNDLKSCFTEFLCIEEIDLSASGSNLSPRKNGSNLSPRKNNNSTVVLGNECKDLDKRKSSKSTSEKCFSNCVGFPTQDEPKSLADGSQIGEKGQDDVNTPKASELTVCAESGDQCNSQSSSLPAPLKLVSALKGSRSKQGIEPTELSVTWSPDVYDPIPTSVSHFPSGKNQRYRNNSKKYGKRKQKGGGKSTQGNKGKDKKKQTQKNSGNPTKCKVQNDDAIIFNEPQVCVIDDLNMVSPDPSCGSSFMKKSVSNLHFPVAEAT